MLEYILKYIISGGVILTGNLTLQFSEGDEEIADIFWESGIRRNAARVLVLLLKDVDVTSREIERACDLRQPEVSIALKDLMKRRWVKDARHSREGKGRPTIIFHLAISLDDILDELKAVLVGDYEKKLHEIEQIRELLRERMSEMS